MARDAEHGGIPTDKSAPRTFRSIEEAAVVLRGAWRLRDLFALQLLFLLPAILAIWSHTYFVTQDGPTHLYNGYILARSFDPASPFRETFAVRWEALPNWTGHLLAMALSTALPPRAADRTLTTITLLALPLALIALRWKVGGDRGMIAAAAFNAILAMNVTWLFGFSSFLLGAALLPVTLGVWWNGRNEGFSARRASELALLIWLGYCCHLVSLGLTACGLVVLEAITPGTMRRGRALTTLLGMCPLPPLGFLYHDLMSRGGSGFAPEWKHLASVISPREWAVQLSAVDPIALARRDVLPFVEGIQSSKLILLTPGILFATALFLFACDMWKDRVRKRKLGYWHWKEYPPSYYGIVPISIWRGWIVLSASLILGGILSPDTLGATHGEYLQPRIVLLGLVALAPVLYLDGKGFIHKVAIGLLFLAWGLQSAFVWDYARTADRQAGAIARTSSSVGKGQRVAPLFRGIRSRFRANPLLHSDSLLGVGTNAILWANYETRFYYFPVRFREDLAHPDPFDFERIALMEGAGEAPERRLIWSRILGKYRDLIDVIVTWSSEPALDEITQQWYRIDSTDGPVRIWKRR